MSLVRWDPFFDLVNIRNSINRLFDEGFRYPRHADGSNLTQSWTFPVDIKDTPDAIVIHAEIPGMSRENISLSYSNNVLTIRGERKNELKEEGANCIRIERKYGSFSRSFSLDVPIDEEAIKASYKDGILEINLPKKDQARTREIEIDVK
ncbi:MAG: Hsp20/alpha crystallin family protein [Peptococcaceae bacterium]|nr:Hsp20/alpha crystallin family protein [Peptococcaceae bacterium]